MKPRRPHRYIWLVMLLFVLAAALALPVVAQEDIPLIEVPANTTIVSSTFDTSTDGWMTSSGTQNFGYLGAGGNPGGHICATDGGSNHWFFYAPGKFLGDVSFAYNGLLTFDMLQYSRRTQLFEVDDIVLKGSNGVTLIYDLSHNPGTIWTSYYITMNETAGWVDQSTGNPVIQSQFQGVLASVSALWFRGEYKSGDDTECLDNVMLAAPGIVSPPPTPTQVSSTFTTTTEGWDVVSGDTINFGWVNGGYICASDGGSGEWFFLSPDKFQGDLTFAYGATLSFNLLQYTVLNQLTEVNDVILIGNNGTTLTYNLPNNPGTSWTSYAIAMTETGGWVNTSTNNPVIESQFRSVLAGVEQLLIRGEYESGDDTACLDNVAISSGGTPPPTPTPSPTAPPTNTPPVLYPPPNQTNAEGDTVSLTLSATDADGDSLTFGVMGLPGGLTLNSLTGLISGTLASGTANGSPYNVTVNVSDGKATDAHTFTWTVTTPGTGCPTGNFTIANGNTAALIAAIEASNDEVCNPGPNTITLAANGVYTLNAPYSTTHSAGNVGLPPITSTITITGNGAKIERSSALNTLHFRIITVFGGSLTVNNTRIENGYAHEPTATPGDGNPRDNGGGIAVYENGSLTLENYTVIHNNRASDGGGGLHNSLNCLLTIRDSVISNNVAGTVGGGLFISHDTTLNSVDFLDNVAATEGGNLFLSTGNVTFNDGQLSGGQAQSGAGVALWVDTTLSLMNVIIDDNHATQHGGGIYNNAGVLNASNTLISRNTTNTGDGGGMYNNPSSMIALQYVSVYQNQAEDRGGGIYNEGNMTLTHTSTHYNKSTANGGGIDNYGSGVIKAHTVSISNNTAGNAGGGFGNSGQVSLTNATLSGNQALQGTAYYNTSVGQTVINASTLATDGVGTLVELLDAPITVKNSILSAPAGTACGGTGSITSGNYNIVTDASCALAGGNDAIVADAGLVPLANNGGDMPTHALTASSPARDHVMASACTWDHDFDSNTAEIALTLDARGSARPFGNGCDSGAFEAGDAVANTPPVATNDLYTTPTSTTLDVPQVHGVLANDSDADGDVLTAVLVADVFNGALTLNADGSFVYTPNTGFSGNDVFTYQANDGSGNSNTATVVISVDQSTPDPTNQPPVAVNDAYATSLNVWMDVIQTQGVLANDTDADGNNLMAVLVSNVYNGTLTLSTDGSFTYLPNTGFTGIDTFTYKANDGVADSNIATVTINVIGGNPPELIAPSDVVTETQGVPIFEWTEKTGATGYQLFIGDAVNEAYNGNVVFYEQNITSADCNGIVCKMRLTDIDPNKVLANGEYMAFLNTSTGSPAEWNGPFTFTISAQPPTVPTVTGVGNTITWTLSGNGVYANTFYLYLAPQNNLLSPVANQPISRLQACGSWDSINCTYNVNLSSSVNYVLYINTTGPGGSATGGNLSGLPGWLECKFDVSGGVCTQPPTEPSGLNATYSSTTVTLTWAASANATDYQVWLGTLNPVVSTYFNTVSAASLGCDASSTCTLTIPNVTMPGIYSWFVQAQGPGGVPQNNLMGWTVGPEFNVPGN